MGEFDHNRLGVGSGTPVDVVWAIRPRGEGADPMQGRWCRPRPPPALSAGNREWTPACVSSGWWGSVRYSTGSRWFERPRIAGLPVRDPLPGVDTW